MMNKFIFVISQLDGTSFALGGGSICSSDGFIVGRSHRLTRSQPRVHKVLFHIIQFSDLLRVIVPLFISNPASLVFKAHKRRLYVNLFPDFSLQKIRTILNDTIEDTHKHLLDVEKDAHFKSKVRMQEKDERQEQYCVICYHIFARSQWISFGFFIHFHAKQRKNAGFCRFLTPFYKVNRV